MKVCSDQNILTNIQKKLSKEKEFSKENEIDLFEFKVRKVLPIAVAKY